MESMEWKKDYEEFEKVTRQFYAGEVPVPKYKGFSGGFGSYAQRGGKSSMLRLRLPGGRVDSEKLKFVSEAIEKYKIDKIHFTTCQTIQLHNLEMSWYPRCQVWKRTNILMYLHTQTPRQIT